LQVNVRQITRADDLRELVRQINRAAWDDDNDIGPYSVAALQAYLSREDTVFVVALSAEAEQELVGMASARIELKPYDQMKWLFIDEVDTSASHRRRGVGKALMVRLLEIARDSGCQEVWLGTESTNGAANGLYRSLSPDAVDQVVGYTFEVSQKKF
jgi:ribosomal protein S18 acetylase RimI-like enzyme